MDKLVSQSELNDYRASLRWYGYAGDGCELTEKVDALRHGDVKPFTGLVRVTRKSTGVTRVYRVGVRWRWTDDFDRDLWKGVFKAH